MKLLTFLMLCMTCLFNDIAYRLAKYKPKDSEERKFIIRETIEYHK